MGEASVLQSRSQEVEADLQAFDNARGKAGDVSELFDILKGKLRPDRKGAHVVPGVEGQTSSGHSTLQAHYRGSASNTVLSTANLQRIQTFLDEPQKHLGQVIADIEEEAGSFYGQVTSKRAPKAGGAGVERLQRGAPDCLRTHEGKRVCLEEVPEMNKYLGPSSRFGDGDGSFWDRWLTTTGYFTEHGCYAKANMPSRSMYSSGSVPPHSGFKRYQLDKLAFPQNPDPRVLTYAASRDQMQADEALGKPKRLSGAYSEEHLSPRSREWLDEALLAQTATTADRGNEARNGEHDNDPEASTEPSNMASPSSADAGRFTESRGSPAPSLDAFDEGGVKREHFDKQAKRNDAGLPDSMNNRESMGQDGRGSASDSSCSSDGPRRFQGAGGVRRLSSSRSADSLDFAHPNYFGRKARTHLYDYFKQVSRRRHQYGDLKAMSLIPLSTDDDVRTLPAYKAGVAAMAREFDERKPASPPNSTGEFGSAKRLPPLELRHAVGAGNVERRGLSAGKGVRGCSECGEGEKGEGDEGDILTKLDEAGKVPQMTSRTKYLVRCMEANVPPRAHMIIRKTQTTKVNLAHQGMGDVNGGILADCLVGLPLMRELNLRDNRLTDKGLIPIVKAIKQRVDLHALDLSENKLDRWAARELALYFSDPRVTVAKFVLSKADVDDFEASNFVKNMRLNKTLTYLDISHNLIGSQESINYVQPQFYTGAEALADWIATESCPLRHLDVSWNTIRLDSAVYFGNAIAFAKNLEHLDLSYNCFGAKGGEAIGASLHVNTSLQTLGLASNSINPRACFVICEGLLCNTSIRHINMSTNALGKVGVGCVMALPAELGDRVQVVVSHCNFMAGCEECWFDGDKLQTSYDLRMDEPYERAVASHLMRRAARDDGLRVKLVAHTMPGEVEKEITLVDGLQAESILFDETVTPEEIFRKYDVNQSGSLDRDELAEALQDLGLGGRNQVDLVISRYDTDGSGSIEESEFHEFAVSRIHQSKKRMGRSKAFMAEASSPGTRWIIPWEGKLKIELEYHRLHNQSCHTSVENADGLLAMLSGIGDGRADVMAHALDSVSLDTEQGLRVYAAVLKHMGGDVIKALAKVIPRMESPSDARLLKNTVLRDLDERRKLRHELGPAYRPLMGLPMGRYELDMAKPTHRLAARKVLEYNNVEKLVRQAGPPLVFDASQKGNWENVRNETINGKSFRFKSDDFEAPPSAGTLEFDYVSTARRQHKSVSGSRQEKAMSARRFQHMLLALGLGGDAEWAKAGEEEFNRAVDETLLEFPPKPRSRKMFEHLHFLMTGEVPPGVKKPIALRPSAMAKTAGAKGGLKKKGLSRWKKSARDIDADPPVKPDLVSNDSVESIGIEMNMGSSVKLSAMTCRLDELIADRWFSVRQCRFLLLGMEDMFFGDEFLQDVLVDFVVSVHPRIVDIHEYMTLTGCLEDRSQAFVIKRVGWLAAWNPCRPDGYAELFLDRREERQVAKMLVHLAVVESADSWASASFRWSTCDNPTPGWTLSKPWQTEEGMPHKGILTCLYRTERRGTERWGLRLALTQTVAMCDVPPSMVASIKSGQGGGTEVDTAGSNDSDDREIDTNELDYASGIPREDQEEHGIASGNPDRSILADGPVEGDNGEDNVEKEPSSEEDEGEDCADNDVEEIFDGMFDRDFVDALCKKQGKDFFTYGA